MRRILTVEEMSSADASAMAFGIPSLVLMERAALSVVEEIIKHGFDTSSILVLCGQGNNGGDGAAIARIFAEKGIKSEIMLFGNSDKFSDQLKTQLHICEHYNINIVNRYDPGRYSLVVDAIFGIGLHRDITGEISEVISKVNESGSTVAAVDIPSGISGNSGRIMGCAIIADLTVTFAAAKIGHYLYPGAEYTGELVIKEIGIPVDTQQKNAYYNIEERDFNDLPKRDESGNKSTFGKLLIIAGSKNIFGAAYFCAKSALKCGIGMIRIVTEETNKSAMNTLLPEAFVDTYNTNDDEDNIEALLIKALDWADGVVIGPGLGTDRCSHKLMKTFLKLNMRGEESLPVVYDADALNLIANGDYEWKSENILNTVTPHIGEMSRLINKPIKEIKSDIIDIARNFAKENNVICILKDARTVTAYPDGKVYINTSGCSALATAGSGDVLSGMTAAFRLRYTDTGLPVEAMAVYLHGLLGNIAAENASAGSVTASELPEILNQIKFL